VNFSHDDRDFLMNSSLFQSLRLKGYAPRTLLDIGANVGEFTRGFLKEFPNCVPTLVEPNPYCIPALKSLPYEIIPVAASDKDGSAEIFLTKEWMQSTGASLYRENTVYFRDEVVVKETVKTACLDHLLKERTFDFVKIDVQGAELDVLNGGTELIRKADYILIEVPVVEYNSGAPPAENIFAKLKEMGFHCAEAVEFHRLGSVMNGNLLQMDFLFERIVQRATQSNCYANADRTPVLEFLKEQKAACPDFSVLDIGAAVKPWAAEVLSATFDMNECSTAPIHFLGNLNKHSDWAPILQHVSRHGKFSYSICTHTLEDLANPSLALEMLPLVSEAGFIACPSKYLELIRPEGPWRGFIHHRWIFCLKDGEVVLVPKIPLIEYLAFDNEKSWGQNPDVREVQIIWRKGLRFTVINGDYLGPTSPEVINMYASILAG
jgi:FkbM family methyltransferase